MNCLDLALAFWFLLLGPCPESEFGEFTSHKTYPLQLLLKENRIVRKDHSGCLTVSLSHDVGFRGATFGVHVAILLVE